MYSWKTGPTRVVQNVMSPSDDWFSDRMRYAPRSETANTATASGLGFRTGWKMSARKNAIGSHSSITTGFQPRKNPRSSTIGNSGRRSCADRRPSRIRSSQPYGVKTMLMFRTSVQTM